MKRLKELEARVIDPSALTAEQVETTQQARISALPELGQGGLLAGQSELKGAAITPLLLTTTDPQEVGNILTSQFPDDIGITQTKDGEFIATNRETGARVSLNKPGLSQIDIIQGLGLAAAFTPAARAAVIPSAIAKRAGAGALTAGATQTAIEGGQALAGGDFSSGEIALAAGLGGLAEVAAPLVAPAAKAIKEAGLSVASKLRLSKSSSELGKKIADESTGEIKKSFEKKLTPSRLFGKSAKETVKQGFDEGMVTVITNASQIDKRRMLQMITTLEKGKADTLFQAKNRPADVAGTSLLKKVNFIKSNNIQAGKQLDRVSKGLKDKGVDIETPVQSFVNDAESMGITFDDDLVPNFKGSQIETIAPAKKLISDIMTRVRSNPAPDALDAHNFKKFIDENVTFGKVAKGLGGKTERIAKRLRTGVNETIASGSPAYKEANKRFSDTITALDSLQKAAGSKIDFFGPNSDKATGTVLRRLMSNAQSRVNLMDSIAEVEAVAKNYGGAFDDDILTQMLFADELEAVFGGVARTSLKGQVAQGIDEASRVTIPGLAIKAVGAIAEKARGINEKNALKSIKKLLKENK